YMAIVSTKGHASECAVFQADQAGRNFQAHPLSGRWKRANVGAAGAGDAVGQRIGTPISTVFPSAVVPLQHYLGRRISWIEIDVSVKDFARSHWKRLAGPIKIVLVRSRCAGRLMRHAAGEGGRAVHPRP